MPHPSAAVVGAGPVGCLAALGLAERGFRVAVYEARSADAFGAHAHASQRSINLAISVRGLTALNAVLRTENMNAQILAEGLPMTARMIHTHDNGRTALQRQQYSASNEAIYSFDRARLNRLLLERAQRHAGIDVHFEHKLVNATVLDTGVALVLGTPDGATTRQASLLVGCDGMHSAARAAVAPLARMSTATEYIDTEYIELHIPPAEGARKWALDHSCLHIWPRHDYMLIALPNPDGSFTSTLFGPRAMYAQFGDPQRAAAFFRANFPDALAVMGEENVVRFLTTRRPNSLGFVRCRPLHCGSSVVLLGDAAHAMVPFYGQGLNCGLEDVRVFVELLDHAKDVGTALARYTASRQDDVAAIQYLALENYVEMRHRVVSPAFRARKWLDGVLVRILPRGWWRTLYSMVTFSNIGYARARAIEQRQQRIVSAAAAALLLGIVRVALRR